MRKTLRGFRHCFLEAAACAKPVIGGRSGGVPEAIVDGVTGLLVDPLDSDDLSNAMTRLLTDRELANRFGQQGQLRAVNDFSWQRSAESVQEILSRSQAGKLNS